MIKPAHGTRSQVAAMRRRVDDRDVVAGAEGLDTSGMGGSLVNEKVCGVEP